MNQVVEGYVHMLCNSNTSQRFPFPLLDSTKTGGLQVRLLSPEKYNENNPFLFQRVYLTEFKVSTSSFKNSLVC
jgi:hypothetical protein